MSADPAQVATAEMAGESDADLLLYMSMAADDAETARAAWEAFYLRHARYLYVVCRRAYAPLLGGEPGVCDLVADAFRRAYEKADRFDPAGVVDPDATRRRTRAWLGRIAQRLAMDALRGRGRPPTKLLDAEHWREISDDRSPATVNEERLEMVRQAILSLSEREQMVIRTTFQWYEPGREHQRLPNDVAEDLARTLRTTPENLRQIRRRAMKKVEAYLREHAVGRSLAEDKA